MVGSRDSKAQTRYFLKIVFTFDHRYGQSPDDSPNHRPGRPYRPAVWSLRHLSCRQHLWSLTTLPAGFLVHLCFHNLLDHIAKQFFIVCIISAILVKCWLWTYPFSKFCGARCIILTPFRPECLLSFLTESNWFILSYVVFDTEFSAVLNCNNKLSIFSSHNYDHSFPLRSKAQNCTKQFPLPQPVKVW